MEGRRRTGLARRRDPRGVRRSWPRPRRAVRHRRGVGPLGGPDPLRLDRLLRRRGAHAGRQRRAEGRPAAQDRRRRDHRLSGR